MEQIKILTTKYAQTDVKTDIALPYKYMPQIIKELTTDIEKIEKVIEGENNSSVLRQCELLKIKLHAKLNFFTNKLTSIPNKKYMEESDEEYVDKNL